MKNGALRIVAIVMVAALCFGLFASMSLADGSAVDVSTYKAEGTYPTEAGMVFAGWYEDSEFTTAYTETTGSAYPKFVSADVLSVKAQFSSAATEASEKTDMRFITSVDGLSYGKVGFRVEYNNETAEVGTSSVYSSILANNGAVTYTPTQFNAASAYFATYILKDVPASSFYYTFTVTPYWVTLDGTKVYGTAKTFVPGDKLPEAPAEDSDLVKYLKAQNPDYVESPVGLDITLKDDIVSICYSTWHDYAQAYNYGVIYDISKCLEGTQDWGPITASGQNVTYSSFHYWSEPALGYYKSTDKSVIRTHMTQLAEAGVDFIIIDNTNTLTVWKEAVCGINTNVWDIAITQPTKALLDTILEMRAEGKTTPYVCFWNRNVVGDSDWQVTNYIYNEFVDPDIHPEYSDLWVYMKSAKGQAKPLMLGTGLAGSTATSTNTDLGLDYANQSNAAARVSARMFSYRTMWGLQNSETRFWSFLNNTVNNPRVPMTDSSSGKTFYEQICVCAAAQASYMSYSNATTRQHGVTFYNQWLQAFKYRPQVVTLTWWNEWVGQCWIDSNLTRQFVDLYTPEASRDLEPMKGGFGDQYYQWMKQYIAAYKNHGTCPRLVEAGY